MKKLIAFAAILATAGTAYADDDMGSKFTHNAEYRVRYQYDQNINGNEDSAPSSQDNIVHRFKLGTTFKASEQLSATLTLLHNTTWGAEYGTTGASTDGNTGKSINDGVSTSENMILVNDAYGTWVVNDQFNLKFGRGSGGLADGSLVGENDWEATPYAFEGLLGTYDHEIFQLQAWAMRFREYADTSATSNQDDDAEVNSMGLAFDFKSLPEFLNLVNIHVIKNDADITYSTGTTQVLPGQDILRYGAVIGGEVAGLDYKVNYEAEDGENKTHAAAQDVATYMYQAEVGYSMPEMMNFRVYALYHVDSGNSSSTTKDETYDPYFYEMHSNAGLMDVLKWGNLTYISLGFTLEPMEDTMLGLHYLMFSRTETGVGNDAGANGSGLGFGNGATTGTAAAGANTKDGLGDEIDLVMTHKYGDGFSITGRLGMFMPGDYLKDSTVNKDDTYTQAFLEAKMTF